MTGETETEWKLLHYLKAETGANCALLILNRPLQPQLKLFHCLWDKASMKASVDGGTNQLFDNMESCDRDKFVPDLISGDFDSVRPEVLEYYRTKGAEVVKTEDQDYTDFTKCLKTVAEKLKGRKIDSIFALGAFGGRLDQVFANVETLYTAQTLCPDTQVYLLSSGSIACLLPKGRHSLHVDTGLEDVWCGLIPVGGACDCVKTTGLKWNLDGQRLKFGELVSTSNTWDGSSVVTIATDSPLLWTMGINLANTDNGKK